MIKAWAIAVCTLTLCLPAYAAEPSAAIDLSQAETMVREGRAAEAYALLLAREAEAAGDPDFDYWLGVAALESGKPDKASIALERVLLVRPDFVGARLDLARAYFALGDYERATLEFKTVLEQDPPPAARETVERYLRETDYLVRSKQRRWTAYLEAAVGYDTNVNNATGSNTVFVPIFGANLTLAPTSVKSSDGYFGVGGGGEVTLPLTEESLVFAGLDYRHRIHLSEKDFDFNRFDVRVGLQIATGRSIYRASAGYGRHYLDNRYNYETTGGSLEWRYAFDDRNAMSVIGLRNRLRFPDPLLEGNNANQNIFGVGWAHALTPEKTTIVFASLFGGREQDTNNRVDGQRKLMGVRVAGNYGVRGNLDAYATIGYQVSDYDRENVVFETTRKDHFYEIAVGLLWRLKGDWSLRPQIAYTRNDSNILIYEYDRYELSLTLRYDFR